MAVREIDPLWQAVYRALLNKIAYIERDYMELSEDYLSLELRNSCLVAANRRMAARERFEIAQRQAKAVNDG